MAQLRNASSEPIQSAAEGTSVVANKSPVWSTTAYGLLETGHEMPIFLNGFQVDPQISTLMDREDWLGKRTGSNWLTKFPAYAEGTNLPFVEFIGVERAISENAVLRHAENKILRGLPDVGNPPGDFDPEYGYLIGFTDYCDSGIFVDLRPRDGARLIYDNQRPDRISHAIAFTTLPEFTSFYLGQHDG